MFIESRIRITNTVDIIGQMTHVLIQKGSNGQFHGCRLDADVLIAAHCDIVGQSASRNRFAMVALKTNKT